jgi:hypothetical protein
MAKSKSRWRAHLEFLDLDFPWSLELGTWDSLAFGPLGFGVSAHEVSSF